MELPPNNKLYSRNAIAAQISQWKSQGKRIVFTNGCFDILHPGHVDYLQKAQKLGDILVLGLNTDASVKRLNKGPERPLNQELARAYVLAGLHAVDALVLFDEDTPLELIQHVQPDILVKGADYDADETQTSAPKYIVGANEVRQAGGTVDTISFLEGFSTTDLVEKIKRFG